MKNPVELLQRDHDELRRLFRSFESLGEDDGIERQTLAEKIIRELGAHSEIEESIFYPYLLLIADDEIREVVLEGIEEHRVATSLLDELKVLTPDQEEFLPKMRVLMGSVRSHMEDEENQVFPYAEDNGEDLAELGEKIESLREELLTLSW